MVGAPFSPQHVPPRRKKNWNPLLEIAEAEVYRVFSRVLHEPACGSDQEASWKIRGSSRVG